MARTRTTHDVDDAVIDENTKDRPELAVFAKTLNRLLVENGIHQDDLAKALNISSGIISNYRNGRKEPRLSMIVKIANYLDVDCHYLMTGVQAKNYTVANDLGLSEKAISKLHELSEYIKANPPGLVQNPYDVLLSFEGPEIYTLQPDGINVTASKVFEVSLSEYLHERSMEVEPNMIADLDDESQKELFLLNEQLANIGHTVVPKQKVINSILQDACDALKALFREYGDNMRGGGNDGKH